MKIIKDGEPCSHRGCLSHRSHPCEGCGRIAGKGEVVVNYMADLLKKYGRTEKHNK